VAGGEVAEGFDEVGGVTDGGVVGIRGIIEGKDVYSTAI
jgi:hypothetical protein